MLTKLRLGNIETSSPSRGHVVREQNGQTRAFLSRIMDTAVLNNVWKGKKGKVMM